MADTNSLKKCLYCGEVLPPRSRSDRKFCPEKFGIRNHCKNSVHNPKVLAKYHENKGLNNINTTNNTILRHKLGAADECLVTEQELISLGFKLEYVIVKARMTVSKNEAFLYLQYGLEVLGNNNYKIFKHGKQF